VKFKYFTSFFNAFVSFLFFCKPFEGRYCAMARATQKKDNTAKRRIIF